MCRFEDAIRAYFEEPQEEKEPVKKKQPAVRYIVQGINDLVSETEECESIKDVLTVLNEQAIISLFQVAIAWEYCVVFA